MRNRWMYVCLLAVAMTLVAVLASCKTDGPTSVLKTEDESAIYAAVIRQLATVDDTFGGNLNPTKLYIIRNTDDKAGNPSGQQSDSTLISQTIQGKITGLLRDLPTEIVWIDEFQNAEFEKGTGTVKGNGAIITLGNIYPQEDGSVQVAGSIYVANLAAGGTTYVLEKRNGVWGITGRTGVSWMS